MGFHFMDFRAISFSTPRWNLLSRITLNMLGPTLGLIFVLSLVSIVFIWTEYSYLPSKSALVVITPILLAAVLLVFSS